MLQVETWDKVGEAQCLDNLGLAHYSLGDLSKAAEYYEQSMAIWKSEGEKHALLTCCESLGGVCFHLEEHLRSIECYVQYLTLSQEVGDGSSDHEILYRLGLSNAAIGEYSVSLEFLRQAMTSFIELGDIKNRTACLQNIGSVQGKLGHFAEGLKSLEQALKLNMEMDEQQGIALCYKELGLLFYDEGDNEKAKESFENALKYLTEARDKPEIATCNMHIGAALAASGEYKEAIQYFTTSLVVADTLHKEWPSKAECLKQMGCCQAAQMDHAAIHTFNLALGLWKERGNRAGEANIRMRLAESHMAFKRYERAIEEVNTCLDLRSILGDHRGQAECYFQLGNAYGAIGEFMLAEESYDKCIALRREHVDKYGLADAISALGQLLVADGKALDGLEKHKEALEIREGLEDKVGIAESFNNLAVCYNQTGDQENALKYFQSCLEMMQQGKDSIRECKCLLNMGACYADQGNFARAIEMFEQALLVCRACGDFEDEAACFCNIGSANLQLGLVEKALECYDIGLRILKKLGDKKGEGECLHNMGAANFNDGNTETAVKLFDEAFQIFRSLKDSKSATMCLSSLKSAYIRLGDASQASRCVQLMQEYFPDRDIQSVTEQLELELEQAKDSNDLELQAQLHLKLGDAFEKLEHLAMDHYIAALGIMAELGSLEGVTDCHKRIASIQIGQADFAGALESLAHAATRFEGDQSWRDGGTESLIYYASILYSMGICHLALNQNEEAVSAFQHSISLREEAEDEEGIEECHNQLGVAYSRIGDTRRAMASLSRGAGGQYLAVEDTPGKVVGVSSLASTLMTLKQHEDARKTIEKHETNLAIYKTRHDKKSEANCHNVLGQMYIQTQQLNKAVEAFDMCQKIREGLNDTDGMELAMKRKGCALYLSGDMRSAVEVLEEYLSLVSQNVDRRVFISKNFENSRREEVDACCVLGSACYEMGDLPSASEALKRALALSHESGDRAGEAKCLMAFGEMYSKIRANKRATEHLERALSICIELQDKCGEAKCVSLLGLLHYARGDTSACTKCLEEALALCKQSLISSSEAECLMNIADIHCRQGDIVQAKAHYQRAVKLCKEQLDSMGEARALCGLSQTDLSLGESYAAVDELLESLAIRKSVGDRKGEAECLHLLSHAYTLVGKLSTARKVTEQARQLAMENGTTLDDAKADMLLAKIDMEAGDLDSAIEGLQRARDTYAKTVMLGNNKVFIDPHMLGQCLGELGHVFMLASKFDRSQEVYEQAEQLLEAAEEIDEIASLRCRMGLLASIRKDGSTKPSPELFEQGLQKISESLQAFEKIGSRKGIARCILCTGIVLCRKGEQQKGMQKLRLALDIFKELCDKRSMAETYLEMGDLSSSSPQGVVYLEQSLMLRREASDLVGEARCLRSLADLHSYLGNSRASIKVTTCGVLVLEVTCRQCWQDCLSLKKELQDTGAIKQCLEHLCALYIQVHNISLPLRLTCRQLEDYSRVSDYISQLRDIAHSQKDYDSEAQVASSRNLPAHPASPGAPAAREVQLQPWEHFRCRGELQAGIEDLPGELEVG
eukprot:747627-Hanusia_phi.AAC.2